MSIVTPSGVIKKAKGANTALSNLASVAINTSLISDTDSTDDLGSTTKAWANLYVDTISSITGNALALTPISGQSLTVNLATTGDFIVNTNDLVVDTSEGRVGIGTATPSVPLDVVGVIKSSTNIQAGNDFQVLANDFGLLSAGGTRVMGLPGGYVVNFGAVDTNASPATYISTLRVPNASGTDVAGADWTIQGSLATGNAASGGFLFQTGDAGGSGTTLQTATTKMIIQGNGNVGIGVTPTAVLHLKAGTATASTAPLKFNSGTLMTTAEAGAIEFLTDKFYGTITTGAVRHTFATLESAAQTFSNDVSVPDEVYGVGWNGSVEVPTKNALYDKIETLAGGGATTALDNLASVAINTALISDTDNTDALGTALIGWADLFLGLGAVINFNNGNATITHSAGLLTSNVDIAVPDEVYGVGWNGSTEVATKNALYDKIETLGGAGANTALSNLAAVAINLSLTSDTDITDDLGTGDIRWRDIYSETLNAGLTATDTLKLRGRDVDGVVWIDVLTITSANTVTADLNAITTLGGNTILTSASTVSALTTIGTIATGVWQGTTIKANYLQQAAADLGDADVTIDLSNSNVGNVTNLTIDGTFQALSIGVTGTRIANGFFTDLAVTNTITGNVSGTAATVTGAAQAAITSLGTLTTLTVDDITINGNLISSAGASSLSITPTAGQAILLDGTISVDAGVVTGATSITSTTFVGALTGTASGNLTSGGALGTPSSGTGTNITGIPAANILAGSFGAGAYVISTSLQAATIELGHATDTTLARVSAGVVSIEGVSVLTTAGGTLTGNITLGEGVDPASIGIVMDASISADERYSGITVPGTAGATLAFGDLCYLDVTAAEWLLADADAATTSGSVVLGICVDASTDGVATSMLLLGTVRSAAFPASIALGAPVYVDVTAGDISATQPSGVDDVIRVVGFAVTVEPNTIYFNPSMDFITHT